MGIVIRLGDPAKAFWHTRSVARTMGLNLSEAMATGRLTAGDYAAMVTRCRSCDCVQHCELWLARATATAPAAPETCANANVYNRLKG